MKSILRPSLIYQSVADIPPALLRQKGITAVLLDLDGTLCPSHTETLRPPVARWLKALREEGLALFLLSNNKDPEKVKRFCRRAGISHYAHLARKPSKKGFLKAAAILGAPPSAAAVVGDQIFTDVLGANRAGMHSIFVYSMDYHIWYIKLRHFFEKPFLTRKNPPVS